MTSECKRHTLNTEGYVTLKKLLSILLFSALLFLTFVYLAQAPVYAVPVPGQEYRSTYRPTDDSTILSGRTGEGASTNMGSESYMLAGRLVRNNPSDAFIYRGFLKFNISDIPQTSTIQYAYLKLFGELNKGSITDFFVYQANGSWRENTITWSNQPSVTGSKIAPKSTKTQTGADYIIWDVTSIVSAWVARTKNNYGFSVRSSESGEIYMPFYSQENSNTDKRPELVISFVFNTPTPTPTFKPITKIKTNTIQLKITPIKFVTSTPTPKPTDPVTSKETNSQSDIASTNQQNQQENATDSQSDEESADNTNSQQTSQNTFNQEQDSQQSNRNPLTTLFAGQSDNRTIGLLLVVISVLLISIAIMVHRRRTPIQNEHKDNHPHDAKEETT